MFHLGAFGTAPFSPLSNMWMALEDVFRWNSIAEVDILGVVTKDFKELTVDR
jgi:hypothetical protein